MLGVNLWDQVREAGRLRDEGIGWVGRQLGSARGGVPLDLAEVDHIHAEGLSLAVMILPTADEIFGGGNAGSRRADDTYQQARRMGVPDYATMWVVAPFWPYPTELHVIMAYLSGWTDVFDVGRLGVVGPASVLSHARVTGICHWGWHTWPEPSVGHDPEAQLIHRTELDAIRHGAVAVHETRTIHGGLWTPVMGTYGTPGAV